jgi:hypothetical protein
MLHPRPRVVLLPSILALLATAFSGCDGRPARISPPKVKPAVAAAAAMSLYDVNQDGAISGDELDKCPSLRTIAKDGKVTADMIASYFDRWQKAMVGRVNVSVIIQHNGRPLPKASVKLVPEKFMGAGITLGTGMTNEFGGAGVSVPTADPSVPTGMTPGFYRLEVAKDGESIPAKYNTETTLGLAILGDVVDRPFILSY